MDVKDITYSRLKLGEFIAFVKDVLTLFAKYNADTLGMQVKMSDLKNSLTPLDKAFAIEQASAFSKEIEKADLRRDKAINGIRSVVKAYTDYFDENLQKQADTLLRTISKYGDIANLNYQLESETLRQLADELDSESKLKIAVEALHLGNWVIELKAANEVFAKLYADRNEESANRKPEGKTLDFRNYTVDKYKALAKHLDSKNTLEPSEPSGKLVAELNVLLDKYDRLVKSGGSKETAATGSTL